MKTFSELLGLIGVVTFVGAFLLGSWGVEGDGPALAFIAGVALTGLGALFYTQSKESKMNHKVAESHKKDWDAETQTWRDPEKQAKHEEGERYIRQVEARLEKTATPRQQ